MSNIPVILAILPLLVFIFLIFVKKATLLRASVITLGLYTLLAIFYWKIIGSWVLVSYGKGVFVAVDIFIIIFGAILFIEILRDLDIIKNISFYLSHLSKDYRIQIIIIAWFFESFLEGTAGFGVPAAVAVPLLVAVGLPPVRALMVGLLGNSSPGIFGAAGTPIKIGFSTLNTTAVPYYASLFNLVGIIIPVFMMWIVMKDRENRKKEFIEIIPFALWSGVLFLIPSLFVAKYLGQEFPTIIGSVIGLILAVLSIKFKIFTPKNILALKEKIEGERTMSPLKSFFPYVLMVIFLIVGKFTLGKIGIPVDLGFKHVFNLFNPGLVFIFVSIIVVLIWEKGKISFNFLKTAFKGAYVPFLTISSMLVMVQIMINAGHNFSGIASPINLLAKSISTSWIPFLAPFAGAFGSFMTGSVTSSNVMFGTLFSTAASSMSMNPSLILALLVVGAGLGNMIAMADILTAEAVAGVKNAERMIIRGVIIPCVVCLAIVALFGMIVLG